MLLIVFQNKCARENKPLGTVLNISILFFGEKHFGGNEVRFTSKNVKGTKVSYPLFIFSMHDFG